MGRTISINNLGTRLRLCCYRSRNKMGTSKVGKTLDSCYILGKTLNLKGFLAAFGLLWVTHISEEWMIQQPKQNVWVTLANITHQEAICLSVATPESPFSTCLVCLPLDTWPDSMPEFSLCNNPQSCVGNWDGAYAHLPQVMQEPQELRVVRISHHECLCDVNYTYNTTRKGQNVNAILPVYRNATAWCNYIYSRISRFFFYSSCFTCGDVFNLWG